ncbi:hypothetical protein IE81DRAFT_336022 [Ceraceosorus guamensis]|uniref:Aminopeptidase P N-terminal domain-containing protein n=1 Tax=Ceraceosorus guamensis TaxID=1522189 RepID=A0A316WFX3_9BASI|nr:hypothetical protein IE81DRAFT_336022 [Ceraceosorus guamensis]PWN46125.1 hypothetical protein IE81DRAFT_336022 [Ceraceosorus guamensis]
MKRQKRCHWEDECMLQRTCAAKHASDEQSTSTSGPLFGRPSSSLNPAPNPRRQRAYGQALPHTHPHLFPRRADWPAPPDALHASADGAASGFQVADDELTPGITAQEYHERRKRLCEKLPENSAVLVMGGRVKCMSGNIFYRFRQDSSLWYLTGFQEPDCALILHPRASSPKGYKMTMFVPPRDELNELWNGARTGIDGAVDIFGADEAFAMEPASLLAHLKSTVPEVDHLYMDWPSGPTFPRTPSRRSSLIGGGASGNIFDFLSPTSASPFDAFAKKSDFENVVKVLQEGRKVRPLAPMLDQLRVIKSPAELRIMKRAGDASSAAMIHAMRATSAGRTEGQIQAVFERETALRGAQRPAYVPVVACGKNALTIHYVANDGVLQPGELVCMDAGGEMDGYVSDITRAWPVDGSFTSAQKDLYSAVLGVLKQCTALATPSSAYSQAQLHRRSVELLSQELKRLGFDTNKGGVMDLLYPHSLSHWIGIDLHDTPSIDRSTHLRQGHVLTIEPAVYVPFDSRFPKHFQGMGIRIEDDIAVLEEGNVILSANTPREIEDVEATFIEN